MPKNSALLNEITAVLKIYYDAGTWLNNADYVSQLKAIIGSNQYQSSYMKKSQMTSYFGFTTMQDWDNPRSDRKITESGNRFYEAFLANDQPSIDKEILESLENNTFGRNVCGVSSDSDYEPPQIFIRAALILGYLLPKEYSYILWRLDEFGENIFDLISFVATNRIKGLPIYKNIPPTYDDTKPIDMLLNWGFLVKNGDKIYIRKAVIDNYLDRLEKLQIVNSKVPGGIGGVDEEEDDDDSQECEIICTEETELQLKDEPRNKIYYGAPGTGKSYKLKNYIEELEVNEKNIKRVTFHPSYSYQQFVGSYKPTPIYKVVDDSVYKLYDSSKSKQLADPNNKEPIIDYSFVAGPFLELLLKAILAQKRNSRCNYILIIEELNRANVASVFGDVFQLLDRDEKGASVYPIDLNKDLENYIISYFKGYGIDYKENKILLPKNFFIWATMNNADQGVMPLDSAFKRRWAFKYIGIDDAEKEDEFIEKKLGNRLIKFRENCYNWNVFRKAINAKLKLLGINEDKFLGFFYMSAEELKDSESIKNKLLLYLREDVLRHKAHELFLKENETNTFSDIVAAYDKKITELKNEDFLNIDWVEILKTAEDCSQGGIGGREDQEEYEGPVENSISKLGTGNAEVLVTQMIPVIKLVMINGRDYYNQACKEIASSLGITSNAVMDKCTRYFNINAETFLEHIENGTIKKVLKEKYPEKSDLIDKEL